MAFSLHHERKFTDQGAVTKDIKHMRNSDLTAHFYCVVCPGMCRLLAKVHTDL